MTDASSGTKSLRRRLFGSHLIVMAVALAVLAAVVSIVALLGGGHALGIGRRNDGGPAPVLLGLTAAAVASGIVSWRIAKRLAAPLERIGAATRELAMGNYTLRLPSVGTTELDMLTDDVNRLAHELDSTERRRLRLIGDVAHELRNPLSTIEGTMEALLDGVMPADEDTYARIGREAARLRRLADDLSSLSAAGELGLSNPELVDLEAIAVEVVAQLEPQAAAKGLSLRLAGHRVPPIVGDQDRLTQVLMNVAGNAVQYTDEGEIVLALSHNAEVVVIEVTDTGRGLAAEDQSRIFDRFHRIDEHFTDGTCVGLAIAKLLVDAHGGRIDATSEGLGRGTTLRIELPRSDSP